MNKINTVYGISSRDEGLSGERIAILSPDRQRELCSRAVSKWVRHSRYSLAGMAVTKPAIQARRVWVPQALKPWLLSSGSTTNLLQKTYGKSWTVKLLQHTLQIPRRDENHFLGLPARHCTLVRETVLYCSHSPWMYARTIIPMTTLRGYEKRLYRLGTKPLGHFLFNHPNMQRSPLEIIQLTPNNFYYQRTAQFIKDIQQHNFLWARQSIFTLSGKPLLLIEVFLPEMISALNKIDCHGRAAASQ